MSQQAMFLDVPGVLFPIGSSELSESALKKLKEVVTQRGNPLLFLTSSTWRTDTLTEKTLTEAFEKVELPPAKILSPAAEASAAASTDAADAKETAPTPVKAHVDSALHWLHANPQVTRWVIIDGNDLSVDDRTAKHFVKCNPAEGLSSASVESIHAVLDEESSAAVLPLDVTLHGVVKRYNPTRGFGFLTCNGVDLFVHQSCVNMAGFRALNVGAAITFKVALDNGKRQAIEVHQETPYSPPLRDFSHGSNGGAGAALSNPEHPPPLAPRGRGRGGRGNPYVNQQQMVMPVPLIPEGLGWKTPNGTVYYGLQMQGGFLIAPPTQQHHHHQQHQHPPQ